MIQLEFSRRMLWLATGRLTVYAYADRRSARAWRWCRSEGGHEARFGRWRFMVSPAGPAGV